MHGQMRNIITHGCYIKLSGERGHYAGVELKVIERALIEWRKNHNV
jgi:hypothetical protein